MPGVTFHTLPFKKIYTEEFKARNDRTNRWISSKYPPSVKAPGSPIVLLEKPEAINFLAPIGQDFLIFLLVFFLLDLLTKTYCRRVKLPEVPAKVRLLTSS